eukprot:4172615-Amphidinium_carterae.2
MAVPWSSFFCGTHVEQDVFNVIWQCQALPDMQVLQCLNAELPDVFFALSGPPRPAWQPINQRRNALCSQNQKTWSHSCKQEQVRRNTVAKRNNKSNNNNNNNNNNNK